MTKFSLDRTLSMVACGLALFAITLCSTRLHAQIARTDGTAMTMSGTPTLGTCGSGPTLSSDSTDYAGTITVGTGVVTSCAVNFSATQATAPACVVSPSLATVSAGVSTTTSALTVGLSLTLGGGKIFYHCF